MKQKKNPKLAEASRVQISTISKPPSRGERACILSWRVNAMTALPPAAPAEELHKDWASRMERLPVSRAGEARRNLPNFL